MAPPPASHRRQKTVNLALWCISESPGHLFKATDTVAEQGARAVTQIYKCRAQETFRQWVTSMPPPETTAHSEAGKAWMEPRRKHLQLLSCSVCCEPHGYTRVSRAASTEGHLHPFRVARWPDLLGAPSAFTLLLNYLLWVWVYLPVHMCSTCVHIWIYPYAHVGTVWVRNQKGPEDRIQIP